MTKISVFFVLLLLLTTGCDRITDPVSLPPGLPGVVVSAQTNSPVEGATVSIAGHTGQTAPNGRFFFFDVSRGEHVITVTKAGYVPYEERVTVTGSTELRIALVPQS